MNMDHYKALSISLEWSKPIGRLKIQAQHSQHFIFFLTYEWAQYARVSYYSRLERLVWDKQSCLLDPFVSYEEN